MKRAILFILPMALALVSCQKEPVASCRISPDPAFAGEQVIFENLSTNAESFEWNFGDGSSSTDYNPTHIYAASGTYSVSLTAVGRNGSFDVLYTDVEVIPAVADFYLTTELPYGNSYLNVQTDLVYVGEAVTFNNTSTSGLSYEWDFGDGYGSNAVSPVYSFDSPGTYTVSLVVKSGAEVIASATSDVAVYNGSGSTVRITVKEYYQEYAVPDASVILFPTLTDWENQTNPGEERFTSTLGKVIFENLDNQRYYVDVWEAHHDNYTLASEDVGFIETQVLTPGYIHDFFAYVDYYADAKKVTLERVSMKMLAKESVKSKDVFRTSDMKQSRFSKSIKNAEQ